MKQKSLKKNISTYVQFTDVVDLMKDGEAAEWPLTGGFSRNENGQEPACPKSV